jgi:hypothetical protein
VFLITNHMTLYDLFYADCIPDTCIYHVYLEGNTSRSLSFCLPVTVSSQCIVSQKGEFGTYKFNSAFYFAPGQDSERSYNCVFITDFEFASLSTIFLELLNIYYEILMWKCKLFTSGFPVGSISTRT